MFNLCFHSLMGIIKSLFVLLTSACTKNCLWNITFELKKLFFVSDRFDGWQHVLHHLVPAPLHHQLGHHGAQGLLHRAPLSLRSRRSNPSKTAMLQIDHQSCVLEKISPQGPVRLSLHPRVPGKDLHRAVQVVKQHKQWLSGGQLWMHEEVYLW